MQDLFQLQLFRTRREDDPQVATIGKENAGYLIQDKSSGATSWRSESLGAKLARGVKRSATGPRRGASSSEAYPAPLDLKAKVWLYQLERAPQCHVLWEICYIADMLHRPDEESRWMSPRNLAKWAEIAEILGCGDGHVHPGTKGLKMRSKNAGEKASDLEISIHTPESLFTTTGLLIALLLYICPINSKERKAAEIARGERVSFEMRCYALAGARNLNRRGGLASPNADAGCKRRAFTLPRARRSHRT